MHTVGQTATKAENSPVKLCGGQGLPRCRILGSPLPIATPFPSPNQNIRLSVQNFEHSPDSVRFNNILFISQGATKGQKHTFKLSFYEELDRGIDFCVFMETKRKKQYKGFLLKKREKIFTHTLSQSIRGKLHTFIASVGFFFQSSIACFSFISLLLQDIHQKVVAHI